MFSDAFGCKVVVEGLGRVVTLGVGDAPFMGMSTVGNCLDQATDAEWHGCVQNLLEPVLHQVLTGTTHTVSYHLGRRRVEVTWMDGPRREAVEASIQAVMGALPADREATSLRVMDYAGAGQVLLQRTWSAEELAVAVIEQCNEAGCVVCGSDNVVCGSDNAAANNLDVLLARSAQEAGEVPERERLKGLAKLLLHPAQDPTHRADELAERLCHMGHAKGLEDLAWAERISQ